jgi:hypothetical protein
MQKFLKVLLPQNRRELLPPGRPPSARVKPPNAADTKKHEKEKHRLKEIDTCKSAQGGIEKFFTKPG